MKTLISLVGRVFGGFLVLVLAGCNGQIGYPTTFQSSTLTPLPVLIVTNIPTSTPIPTLMPSLTPLPTLSSGERDDHILDLISDNGGCRLPCWWGITPGRTTSAEAWNFFLQFDPTFATANDDQLSFLIPVSKDISLAYGIQVNLGIAEDFVRVITIRSIESATNFNIQRILVDYGKPSEIWIHAYRSYLGGIPPGDVLLFYPDQGIFVRYANGLSEIDEKNDSANICLDTSPDLTLWSLDEPVDFERVQDLAWLDYKKYGKPLLSLEQATGITIEQFYDYRTKERICLTTKLSLWPEP